MRRTQAKRGFRAALLAEARWNNREPLESMLMRAHSRPVRALFRLARGILRGAIGFCGQGRNAMKRESLLDPASVIRSAAHWRMRAKETRTLAQDAMSPTARAMMLRIAADYDRLAKHAGDSAAKEALKA